MTRQTNQTIVCELSKQLTDNRQIKVLGEVITSLAEQNDQLMATKSPDHLWYYIRSLRCSFCKENKAEWIHREVGTFLCQKCWQSEN